MQMTIRQFVKNLKSGLSQAAVNESLKLGKGQCADFADYKKHVGVVAGYERASSLADSMLRQLEEADRDDDLPAMKPS